MPRVTARSAFSRFKARQDFDQPRNSSQLYRSQIQKIPLVKERSIKKKAIESNKKITDFFAVSSKGRENMPKSPQITRARTRSEQPMAPIVKRTRRSVTSSDTPMTTNTSGHDIEVVTISDSSDDENSDNPGGSQTLGQSLQDLLGSSQSFLDLDESNHLSTTRELLQKINQSVQKPANNRLSISLDTSKSRQTRKPRAKRRIIKNEIQTPTMMTISPRQTSPKVEVDEDVEVVEVLPPIPLRDHPIYEVEE